MAEATEPKTRNFDEAAQSLASALEATEETKTEEEKVEETANPPEPETAKEEPAPAPKEPDADNAERTRLGRRVKKLEELIGELVTELKESRKPPEVPPDIPETISTPDDVLKVVAIADRKKQETQVTYQNNYRKAIDALGDENNDIHEEVIREILAPNSPFNQILSDNPFADAERNYYRAVKAVLKKRVAPVAPKPRVAVRGEKPIAPTGVPTGTTVNAPARPATKLDDYAKEFAKRMGLSEKFISEAVK